MRRYNKATAAVLAGAVITILQMVFPIDPQVADALGTVLTALAVWVVPNKEAMA